MTVQSTCVCESVSVVMCTHDNYMFPVCDARLHQWIRERAEKCIWNRVRSIVCQSYSTVCTSVCLCVCVFVSDPGWPVFRVPTMPVSAPFHTLSHNSPLSVSPNTLPPLSSAKTNSLTLPRQTQHTHIHSTNQSCEDRSVTGINPQTLQPHSALIYFTPALPLL